jgi:hypothetical protein
LKMNKTVQVPHPNLWKFIEILEKEELDKALKYIRLDSNILKTNGRHKKDLEILKIKTKYLEDRIDLKEQVAQMATKVTDYE